MSVSPTPQAPHRAAPPPGGRGPRTRGASARAVGLVVAAVVILCGAAAAQTEVDLTPTDDAYVRGGSNSGTNYNTDELRVKDTPDRFGEGGRRVTLLRFSLDGLSGYRSATLRLYTNRTPSEGFDIVALAGSTTEWSEATVTWGDVVATGSPLSRVPVSEGDTWYEWDVTSHVIAQLNEGAEAVTLVVQGVYDEALADFPLAAFRSKENGSGNPPVLRLSTTAPPLVAVATADVTRDVVPLTVAFDASRSTSPNPAPSYTWDFGDGATASGVTVTHTFTTGGSYNVVLTVADTGGETARDTVRVEAEALVLPNGPRLRDLAAARGIQIGAATANRFWAQDDAEAFETVLEREFSILSPENGLKQPTVSTGRGQFRWTRPDSALAFAERSGLDVHGHVLVWYRNTSAKEPNNWLNDPAQAPCSEMAAIMREHIDTVMSRYAGQIAIWDVVNEAADPGGQGYRTENRWHECLGVGEGGVPNYIRLGFQIADSVRTANGDDVELIYNEVGGLTDDDNPNREAMQETVLAMLTQLQSEGVPIDGMGIQFHDDLSVDQAGWANFATRVSDLGLDVHITELDIEIPAESPTALGDQAQVYAQVLERFLAVPRRSTFTTWGFTDRYSWKNPANDGDCHYPLIFHGGSAECPSDFAAYAPKPAYYALQDVLAGGSARTEARDAFARIEAEGHEAQRGARTLPFARNAQGQIQGRVEAFGSGDYLKLAQTDFGGGARMVTVSYAAEGTDPAAQLELRLGAPDGELVGTVALPGTDGEFATTSAALSGAASGVADLYVVGAGADGPAVRLDWMEFVAGGVANEGGAEPISFAVGQVYPNPVAGPVTVSVDLPEAAEVSVAVFDVLGRRVLAAAPGRLAAGPGQRLALDAGDLPSGTYLVRVAAQFAGGAETATARFTVAR